jgi:hypothetical protein
MQTKKQIVINNRTITVSIVARSAKGLSSCKWWHNALRLVLEADCDGIRAQLDHSGRLIRWVPSGNLASSDKHEWQAFHDKYQDWFDSDSQVLPGFEGGWGWKSFRDYLDWKIHTTKVPQGFVKVPRYIRGLGGKAIKVWRKGRYIDSAIIATLPPKQQGWFVLEALSA